MTLVQVLVTSLSTLMGAVIVALIGWWALRKYRAAGARDLDGSSAERRANARQTEGEAWREAVDGNTDLFSKVQVLQQQVINLTTEHGNLSHQHNVALAYIGAVVRWEATGRPGPIPTPPSDLQLLTAG